MKRNVTKRDEKKRQETKRNKTKRNETKFTSAFSSFKIYFRLYLLSISTFIRDVNLFSRTISTLIDFDSIYLSFCLIS